ncbi:MAG: peroxiredoxin family protein, partial [Planctomycetota bacterium]
MIRFRLLPIYLALIACGASIQAAEPVSSEVVTAESIAAGHSYHGEVFNEGPRQAAILMDGMAKIDFPTSTQSELAQQFIEQGIAQLHGFWYLEAERSFRQAAKADDELAIAYWGMAMANVNNDKRARGFIDEAKERSKKNTSRREKLYIDALDRFLPKSDEGSEQEDEPNEAEPSTNKDAEKEAKKKRGERYIADLEKVLHEFPDDTEAKALLAVQLWMGNRYSVKLTSRYAVEALLAEVFESNPDHPAHHYRIHLWDSERPENALVSAAKCGPAGPGIAHMWHMPGHIYSKLHRYADAAWQQEASARVDHAHMIRTRLMPDQIHNFAHNNEWLVRNLIHLGRANDAIDLSRNLISLPKHPTYNSLKKRGSHKYGRQRLLLVLSQLGLWQQLIDEFDGQYLTPTEHTSTTHDEQGWLAVAQFMTDRSSDGRQSLRDLRRQVLKLRGQSLDLAEGTRGDASSSDQDQADTADDVKAEREKIGDQLGALRKVIARVAAVAAAKGGDAAALKKHAKKAKLDDAMLAQWLAIAGHRSEAIKVAQRAVKADEGEVKPLAVLVDLLWSDGKKKLAKKHFQQLRNVAASADADLPLLRKLKPVANAMEIKGDWRLPTEPASDLGQRPPLETLGPFRWQPYQAESWQATTAEGGVFDSSQLAGRPTLLIFYLGFGCLHCVEQLHEFTPLVDEFAAAGIDLAALSTESVDDLLSGIKAFDQELPLPLYSDAGAKVFKAFRCWDDFENQPLHGTFLIDGEGRVRWQDISYEPFMDAEFLLEESK